MMYIHRLISELVQCSIFDIIVKRWPEWNSGDFFLENINWTLNIQRLIISGFILLLSLVRSECMETLLYLIDTWFIIYCGCANYWRLNGILLIQLFIIQIYKEWNPGYTFINNYLTSVLLLLFIFNNNNNKFLNED